MMAVLELYGKCKELGYCDCSGFFGCVDPRPPAPKPVLENELANAMKAEHEVSDYHNHNYRRELEAIEQSEGALVECEVCDRSHAPSHPHIANIDGDIPIDDEPGEDRPGPVEPVVPCGRVIPARAGLPDWLKDKSGEDEGTRGRKFCAVCGKIKRSNHNCKGQPRADVVKIAEACEDCKSAGELCVRHGGLWSSYDSAKGQPEKAPTDERVAKTLPAAVSVMQSEETDTCRNGHPRTPESTYTRSDGRSECKECKRIYHKNNFRPAVPADVDPEIAAMAAIVEAVNGLDRGQLERVMTYIRARCEGVE
jgi:hypothetical protein